MAYVPLYSSQTYWALDTSIHRRHLASVRHRNIQKHPETSATSPKMPEYTLELVNNVNQTQRRLARSLIPETDVFKHLASLAKAKFAFKRHPVVCYIGRKSQVPVDGQTPDSTTLAHLRDVAESHVNEPTQLTFTRGEPYIIPNPLDPAGVRGTGKYRVIAEQSAIAGDAYKELKRCAKFDGMLLAVGMPDLHPGNGYPIGATFISEDRIYPRLVGGDIGCGMALHQLPLLVGDAGQPALLARYLTGIEGSFRFNEGFSEADFLNANGVAPDLPGGIDYKPAFDSLGTIGRGNHFAEILKIVEIRDGSAAGNLGLQADLLMLLVHSGSRDVGQHVLHKHTLDYRMQSLTQNTPAANLYCSDHDQAVKWAKANRALIAKRVMQALGDHIESNSRMILDICHNSVEKQAVPTSMWDDADQGEQTVWIHRKGAASTLGGAVVIPGSRGARSYVVVPIGDGMRNGFSLAHGAGRSMARTCAKAKFSDPYYADKLYTTVFGSEVVCDNLNLLYEEAPQAYKDVDVVVNDLVAAGACEVVAVMEPVVTYKCRETGK